MPPFAHPPTGIACMQIFDVSALDHGEVLGHALRHRGVGLLALRLLGEHVRFEVDKRREALQHGEVEAGAAGMFRISVDVLN